MEYYIYHDPENELTHWGVKGMRWGVRRYQNKDGSLTKAGLKRRAKLEGELEKLGGGKKKSEADTEEAPRKKTASEMTDAELKEHTNRQTLEKNYKQAVKDNVALDPVKVNKGKKFAETFTDKLIESFADRGANAAADLAAQTAKSIGAKYINQMLEKNFSDAEKVHTNNKK